MLTILFVVLLLIMLSVRVWLSSRQIRHVLAHRDVVPKEFASKIGLTSHQRAADYTVAKARLSMLEMLFDAAVLVALTLLGGLQYIDTFTTNVTSHTLLRQVLLVMSVFMLFGLLGMPFALYRQFKLEAHFGFNRMTLKMFISDTTKETLL
ncbi:MAG: M48 family metallopeptidase, partial [Betaproteobacteria bacterium]